MDRRSFLRNLGFTAAAAVVVPNIVIAQITEVVKKDTDDYAELWAAGNLPKGRLYLFDDKHLIAHTNRFSVNFHRDYHDVTSWGSQYKQYIPGPYSWDVQADRLLWHYSVEDPRDYIQNHKQLQIIAVNETYEVAGTAYLTDMTITIPMDEAEYTDVILHGSGELIMKIEKG